MKLDAILFDLDGTLIDCCPDLTAAVNYTLSRLGRSFVAEAQVRSRMGHGFHGLAGLFGGTVAEIEEALAICRDYYSAHALVRSRLFPGVGALLADLGDVPLVIISNKPEALCRQLLAGLGIADRFVEVLGGDSCAAAKPSPRPIREALGRLQASPWAPPPRAIMVGDTPDDILAATMAPVPSVGVTWGYSSARELEAACAGDVVASVDQLGQWLRSRLAPARTTPSRQHVAV